MYEMLTGQLPFRNEHEAAIMYAILHEEPTRLAALRPEIPTELERIVRKTLSKNPDDRYEHVDALTADLLSGARSDKNNTERLPITVRQTRDERRRLAAIMFTDMAGYSALTLKNERLALDLLDEHRKILRPLFPSIAGVRSKRLATHSLSSLKARWRLYAVR
jgi:serine/threonine protein kinase